MKMRIMIQRAIKIVAFVELAMLALLLISFEFFMSAQVAFLSSFFIIIGSSLAYAKMVSSKASSGEYEDEADLDDRILDPYELDVEYKEQDLSVEEMKSIIKEERSKIKLLDLQSLKNGSRASVSLFRVVPYVLLVLGFIALKNNDLLDIGIYLPSLLVGIVAGGVATKAYSSI